MKSFEVISVSPPPIFKSQYNGRAAAESNRYNIEKPSSFAASGVDILVFKRLGENR